MLNNRTVHWISHPCCVHLLLTAYQLAGSVKDYPEAKEAGGLSGPPLMDPSTDVLADMYKLTGGVPACHEIGTCLPTNEHIPPHHTHMHVVAFSLGSCCAPQSLMYGPTARSLPVLSDSSAA